MSIRVLVVDDDESHRVALVAAVEAGVCLAFGAIGQRCNARCGACYSVRDVATAADAIREVEAWRPHLVISDQMLGTVATGSDVHRACVESSIDCMRVSGVVRCDSAGMLSKALDCRDVRLAVAQWVEGWLPHVLLIEDDPNHAAIERRAIADVLGVPVRVTRAATWQDAPRDLRGFRLVVVDTILPGSSIPGMDIASIVAESGVPVVMVSGAIPARLIHPGGGVPVVPKMLPEMRAAFALALGLGLRLDAGGV